MGEILQVQVGRPGGQDDGAQQGHGVGVRLAEHIGKAAGEQVELVLEFVVRVRIDGEQARGGEDAPGGQGRADVGHGDAEQTGEHPADPVGGQVREQFAGLFEQGRGVNEHGKGENLPVRVGQTEQGRQPVDIGSQQGRRFGPGESALRLPVQVFQAGANRLLLESLGLLVEPLGDAQSPGPHLLVTAFPVDEFLQATERHDQAENPEPDQVRGCGENGWGNVTVTAQGTHDDLHNGLLTHLGVIGVCHGGASAQVALRVAGDFSGREWFRMVMERR